MCDASHDERSNIPRGIWFCQNSITLPKMQVSTPSARKCAAAARPYGPAPIMATWAVRELFISIVSVLIHGFGRDAAQLGRRCGGRWRHTRRISRLRGSAGFENTLD